MRRSSGGIGKVTRAIGSIGLSLGYDVRTKMSAQPKVYLRYTAESGTTRKIKLRSTPMNDPRRRRPSATTGWS